MKAVLPDEYEIMSQAATVLPASAKPVGYPFTGFTVNFNVTTRIHRDKHDLKFCIVIPAADEECVGGDICFLELGIRLQLKTGYLVLFRSKHLSHFNLHYKGSRASIVFHSDNAMEKWAENRNSWETSQFMNVLNWSGDYF